MRHVIYHGGIMCCYYVCVCALQLGCLTSTGHKLYTEKFIFSTATSATKIFVCMYMCQ